MTKKYMDVAQRSGIAGGTVARQEGADPGLQRGAELGHRQPVGLQRVREPAADAAGNRDDTRALALRLRTERRRCGDVEHVVLILAADHAVSLEDRLVEVVSQPGAVVSLVGCLVAGRRLALGTHQVAGQRRLLLGVVDVAALGAGRRRDEHGDGVEHLPLPAKVRGDVQGAKRQILLIGGAVLGNLAQDVRRDDVAVDVAERLVAHD